MSSVNTNSYQISHSFDPALRRAKWKCFSLFDHNLSPNSLLQKQFLIIHKNQYKGTGPRRSFVFTLHTKTITRDIRLNSTISVIVNLSNLVTCKYILEHNVSVRKYTGWDTKEQPWEIPVMHEGHTRDFASGLIALMTVGLFIHSDILPALVYVVS